MDEFDAPLPKTPSSEALELAAVSQWIHTSLFPALRKTIEEADKQAHGIRSAQCSDEWEYREAQELAEFVAHEPRELEQALVNQLFVQLYHFIEHQLSDFATDMGSRLENDGKKDNGEKLVECLKPENKKKREPDLLQFFRCMRIDHTAIEHFDDLDTLRLIANFLKHADQKGNEQKVETLRKRVPKIFDPKNRDHNAHSGIGLWEIVRDPVLFLDPRDYPHYVEAAQKVWEQIHACDVAARLRDP